MYDFYQLNRFKNQRKRYYDVNPYDDAPIGGLHEDDEIKYDDRPIGGFHDDDEMEYDDTPIGGLHDW